MKACKVIAKQQKGSLDQHFVTLFWNCCIMLCMEYEKYILISSHKNHTTSFGDCTKLFTYLTPNTKKEYFLLKVASDHIRLNSSANVNSCAYMESQWSCLWFSIFNCFLKLKLNFHSLGGNAPMENTDISESCSMLVKQNHLLLTKLVFSILKGSKKTSVLVMWLSPH